MEEDQVKYPVEVHLYSVLPGSEVWHSGIVAYGREYFFTSRGVVSVMPGSSVLGEPKRVERLGETQLPYSVFLDYVLSLGENKFRPGTWHLVTLNTNTFCDEVGQFLAGVGLPKFTLDINPDILQTSVGQAAAKQAEILSHSSEDGGLALGLIGNRSEPEREYSRASRQNSPDFDDLQAQIEALRADQLSLEERRNALNLQGTKEDKKKTKKDKEKEKDRKRKKPKKKQQSVGSTSECNSPSPIPASQEGICDESKTVICDINRHSPTQAPRHQHSLTQSQVSVLKEKTCDLSPTQSILSNANSSDKSSKLPARKKSLKRVSFEEEPSIIEDSPEPFQDTPEEPDLDCDLPLLEEVEPPSPLDTLPVTPPVTMAAADEQIEIPSETGEGEQMIPKKERKPHVKGITFREFDHVKDFEDLVRTIVTLCSGEEQERLREMEDWIVKAEGTWVLAEGFNTFLSNVFHRQDWPSEARVAMLRLLSYGAKEDDIVLILHMDRKDHSLMNYAQQFDRLPVKEQENLALLFCNLFETGSASEWLMYISEWEAPGGGLPLSNIRVTTKVAVNALLGDTPTLVNYGSALMANLGDKEVFDDVCSELAMAILQFFQGSPAEEHVWRCMKALLKFCTIGSREVPQLVKMIGPDPSKFKGMSGRVDEVLEPIMARLASVPMF